MAKVKITGLDRMLLGIAPKYALERIRARIVADQVGVITGRNYDAASQGRRTTGWARTAGDADQVSAFAASELRMHARDLLRNNAWARRGQKVVANNSVGWGIVAKPEGTDEASNKIALERWKAWAGKKKCTAEGRRTFAGLQHQAMRAIFSDGEVLVRRRIRRPSDGLPINMQLQLLEADFLDSAKAEVKSASGGPTIRGVEYDMLGRRAYYWLFDAHPGSGRQVNPSRKIPASEVLHVFDEERIGQSRGISWLASGIVNLKDLDEYDDAELVAKKIAACFAGFITDDGNSGAVGVESVNPAGASLPKIESFEPGMVVQLPLGKKIEFGQPPPAANDDLAKRTLRRIAAACNVTYEDLTGDYSQVNFSSARMGKLAHWADVYQWQENMLIPLLCDGVWDWAMELLEIAGVIRERPDASWICPAMPVIEPGNEVLARTREVRAGFKTFSQSLREQGIDPDAHFTELEADKARIEKLGLMLDSDASKTSQAGLTQERVGGGGAKAAAEGGEDPPKDPPEKEKRNDGDDLELDITEEDFPK